LLFECDLVGAGGGVGEVGQEREDCATWGWDWCLGGVNCWERGGHLVAGVGAEGGEGSGV